MDSSAYQWEIVKKLSFCRPAGTPECERAAEMIAEEVRALGGDVTFEPFSFPGLKVDRAVLRVTEPYQKEYSAVGVGFSGEIEGDFGFRYVERGTEYDLDGVDGGIILINKLDPDHYTAAVNSKADGFIAPSGKFYDDSPLTPKNLGRKMRSKW